MKLNKYFTLCYSLYFNILHYPRVFTHLAPHLYFPFPTESQSRSKAQPVWLRFFCVDAARQELALVRDGAAQKNAAASAEALCFDFDDGPRRKGCATAGSKSRQIKRGGRGRITEPHTGPSHPEGRLGHLSYI